MTDPPKRQRATKTVMNVRSAEGAFVTAIARQRSNQLRSRTSDPVTKRTDPPEVTEQLLRERDDINHT